MATKIPTYGERWPTYAKQWDSMKVRPEKLKSFETIAKKLIANKPRYLKAEKLTGVPWYMIALLHMRESDNNFNTQLAQGDPLNQVSVNEPDGRGPFKTWEDGAKDALITLKGFDKIIDWRLEKILYYSELYNGWGYFYRGVPSAYVWSGSTVYNGGKYIADHVWSSTAVDKQPGVAPVLKIMMELDKSIQPQRETPLAGAGTGAVIAAGGAVAVSQTDPVMWPYIIVGTIVVAVVGWLAVRWYKRRTLINDKSASGTHAI